VEWTDISNGKSYTIGELQLYAPYHEDNRSWPPTLRHADL
jgi:hypothetical protein